MTIKSKQLKRNNRGMQWAALFLVFLILVGVWVVFFRSAPAAGQSSDEPVRVFSSYWGGSLFECQFDRCASTVDSAGNIYIAGPTGSDDFPLVNQFSDTFTPNSFEDIFVTKIDGNTKQVLFSTYLGRGEARGVAVDSAGNVVIAGVTGDANFAVTDDAAQSTFKSGVFDGVVVKLSGDGSQLLYSTFLGGTGRDELIDVVLDAADNIYVTGWTDSTDYPVTFNPAQSTFGGNQDMVVTKILSTGGLFYSTYLGGDRRDKGVGLAVDGAGNLTIVGTSGSDGFPTTAGVIQPQRASNAGNDATITKLNPSGVIQHSTFYDLTTLNDGVAIDIDEDGNSYVLTRLDGVIKLNPTLSQQLYQNEFELTTGVLGEGGIFVDSEGVAFITGWTGQTTDKDVVLAALSSGGQLIHYQTVGGSDEDRGYSIDIVEASDGKKTAYIVGRTESTDFPTLNPIQANLAGGGDVLLIEITNLENIGPNMIYLPLVVR